VASFSASPTMGSAPLTVQFTDLSTNSPTSWSWNFGDGTGTSTVENPSYTYSTAGTYTVTMTATNTAGSNQATSQTIIVSPASETPQVTLVTIATPTPVPTFPSLTFSGTPTSGAAPLTVQFTTSTSGTPTSWSWDFGDGGSSKVQNPSYTYVIPGIYTVTLTANYPEGSQPVVMSSYITVTSGSTHSPLSPFIAVGAIGTMGMISVVMSRRKRQ
jgi:PKD repeat protein